VVAVAGAVDVAVRARDLVQDAIVKCSPPTATTAEACLAIANEMSTICGSPERLASAMPTPVAMAATSVAAAAAPMDGIAFYRLNDGEVQACGTFAILAFSMRRLLGEQSALANRYRGSVEESYLMALAAAAQGHDEKLNSCRSALRGNAAVLVPVKH
jgi:hypothetical protein